MKQNESANALETNPEAVLAFYAENSVKETAMKFNLQATAVTEFLKSSNVLRGRGVPTPGREYTGKGRPKTTRPVGKFVVRQARPRIGRGERLIEVASALNVNAAQLSAALKESGVILKRGRKSGQKAA